MAKFSVSVEIRDDLKKDFVDYVRSGEASELLGNLFAYYMSSAFDREAFEGFCTEGSDSFEALNERFREFSRKYSKEATTLRGVSQVIGSIKD